MQQETTVHKLSCGMPFIICENHEIEVATADIWVRTGSADEPVEINGVSHFLEHMLFKGTKRYGLGEIENRIESLGGVCNAATSLDFTHYYVTMPSGHIGTGIEMLGEMVRSSTLDESELEKERLVILEEYRRKQDHPTGILYEQLYATFFQTGPYHQSVIGTEETIQSINREQMLDYYHKRYSPENMALVICGDVTHEITHRAESVFSGFAREQKILQDPPPTKYGRGTRNHIEKPTGGEVYVTWSFPAPGLGQPGSIQDLDIAQFILGQGRASILHQQLKEKKNLCSSISTYYPTHTHDSLFVFMATCTPGQRDALRDGLISEITTFLNSPPDTSTLTRARRLLCSSHLFSMETSSGAATNTGYYYTLTGDTAFLDEYIRNMDNITPESVRNAALEVFGSGNLSDTMVEISVGPEET
jgi:zinc protease